MTHHNHDLRASVGPRILVAGAGVAGRASAQALLELGREVTVYDARDSEYLRDLEKAGATVCASPEFPTSLLDAVDEVVISPGFSPHHPLAEAASERGLDIYCEPELAWRIRGPQAAPWLGITGTNGKTTTTTMLASILNAANLRTAALGNIGQPLVSVSNGPWDALAVELSSFQLHWSQTMAPKAGAIINLSADHLDWHGDLESYVDAKANIWRSGTAIVNLDDPAVVAAAKDSKATIIGFTLHDPDFGHFGVREGWLVDGRGQLLCRADDIRPSGAHNVANALAAAALAYQVGVGAADVGEGLRTYQPEPHRNIEIAVRQGVRWVDDSKATNPHAAQAALNAYESVVWIAGGQLKGVDIVPLVSQMATKLKSAVLLGQDRLALAEALKQHAPQLPVVIIDDTDDTAMDHVVEVADQIAEEGDTVLLSPAAASFDMYSGYVQRGEAFAASLNRLDTAQ